MLMPVCSGYVQPSFLFCSQMEDMLEWFWRTLSIDIFLDVCTGQIISRELLIEVIGKNGRTESCN